MAGRKGEKIWADAVRRAVMRRMEEAEGQPQKIERLADKVVDMGLDGDVSALKEIGDRLDGKPVAQSQISGPDGGPIETRSATDMTDDELAAIIAAGSH